MEELKKFLAQSQYTRNKLLLSSEIKKIEAEIVVKEEKKTIEKVPLRTKVDLTE